MEISAGDYCTYIVVTDPNPSSSSVGAQRLRQQAQSLVDEHKGELLYTYESVFQGFAARFSPDQVELLRENPAVKWLELNQPVQTLEVQNAVPSWGLDRIDQAQTELDGRYFYPDTGAGVDVYVVDSGIRADHLEFEGRVKPGYSAMPGLSAGQDCNGHGTHVAGIIGGKTFGVAKGVTLHPVRVFDCGNTTDVAAVLAGLDWVWQTRDPARPTVLNLSVGISALLENPSAPSLLLNKTLLEIAKRGVFTTIASGNSYGNGCNFSPSSLGGHDNILVVGASTRSDAVAESSNLGPCVDMLAPGESILSAGIFSPQDQKLESGTSMAAAHAAGVAAIHMARNPRATPTQVKQALVAGSLRDRVKIPSGLNSRTLSNNRLLNTAFLGQPDLRVVVEPAAATLLPGQRQVFSAAVVGGSSAGVRWQDSNGSFLGSDSGFTFTAPATAGQYTLTAVSVADSSKTATARVTVANPTNNITAVAVETDPTTTTLSPGATVGLSATVSGTGSPNNRVSWRVVSGGGSLSSTSNRKTVYTAPYVSSDTDVVIEAAAVDDPSKTARVSLTVIGQPSSITGITIAFQHYYTPTIAIGGTLELSATVTGAATYSPKVVWAIESGGGSLSTGSGLRTTYIAPQTGGAAMIRATSVEDPSKSATLTVTVEQPPGSAANP